MKEQQQLYYVIGQLAYAVARADEVIEAKEKQQLQQILVQTVMQHDIQFDFDIMIFHILQKDKKDFETTYNWAIHSMKLSRQHFTVRLKEQFADILRQVTAAFPSVAINPDVLIERFQKDLTSL